MTLVIKQIVYCIPFMLNTGDITGDYLNGGILKTFHKEISLYKDYPSHFRKLLPILISDKKNLIFSYKLNAESLFRDLLQDFNFQAYFFIYLCVKVLYVPCANISCVTFSSTSKRWS